MVITSEISKEKEIKNTDNTPCAIKIRVGTIIFTFYKYHEKIHWNTIKENAHTYDPHQHEIPPAWKKEVLRLAENFFGQKIPMSQNSKKRCL